MKHILAGKTSIPCDTMVVITKCDDEPVLVGIKGHITHPFPGLILPSYKYIAGLLLTPESIEQLGPVVLTDKINLCEGDEVEVFKDES